MKRVILAALCVAGGLTSTAQATNGLFLIGAGNTSRGMGGVGIAAPLDSLSAYINPATIAGMRPRMDVGGDLFIPISEARLGSVTAKSENDEFGITNVYPMPSFGYVFRSGGNLTFGIHAAPAGGGASYYKTNFFQAAASGTSDPNVDPTLRDPLGVNLLVFQINPTVAWRSADGVNAVGVTLVTAIARFSAYGIGLFDPFTPTQGSIKDFSDQGQDWSAGAGLRLGWLGSYGDWKLGLTWTSRVNMMPFKEYEELFAEGGDLDLPPVLGIGFSYRMTPRLLLAMDLSQTFYERIRAISNRGPNLAGQNSLDDPEGQKLGRKEGLGFGWRNQVVSKIGLQYRYSDKLTVRAGWDYGKSPINEDREIIFNLLAPASTQNHLTLGATWRLASGKDLNFSWVHAFEHEQAGPTYVSDDGSNYGSLKMYQNAFGLSLTVKYN